MGFELERYEIVMEDGSRIPPLKITYKVEDGDRLNVMYMPTKNTDLSKTYKRRQAQLERMIDSTTVSVREEYSLRGDIPYLISLGLDPLVYFIRPYDNNQGAVVDNKWWWDTNFHIIDGKLIPLYDYKEDVYLPKGLAASASHTHKNSMI